MALAPHAALVPFESWNLPRVSLPADFELGSGLYANTVTPEQAAAALRLWGRPPPAVRAARVLG